jgi:RRG7 (Required for Respiratory Growth 7) protein
MFIMPPRISRLLTRLPTPKPLTSRLPHPRCYSKPSTSKEDASSTDGLLYPDPPNPQHSDLDSFLAYASRTGLDTSSTVYVGTHYEYTVGLSLARYGLAVRRVGGPSDFGIDLLGTWSLPSQPQPLRVILQCKGGTQKIGPSLIRELEGSFVGAPPGWRAPSKVLAFLVSEKPATKGVRDSLGRSSWPMGYISCSKDGLIKQMIWNRRAEENGLEGVGVSVRHAVDAGQPAHLVLTWDGKQLLPKETPP